MAILPIVIGSDHPILRTKTRRVPAVTKKILAMLKNMEDTMQNADGVGLAAPQIGVSIRVCIAIIEGTLTHLINPKITWRSAETCSDEEGCLSLPGIWLSVPRAREIHVRFQDPKGKPQERKLADFAARVVQHEVDHLDGVLIVDYTAAKST